VKPRVIRKREFKVVGLAYVGRNQHGEIAQMWGKFNERAAEIKHHRGRGAYGLCYELGRRGMEYIAGLPVSSLAGIPTGMLGKKVPAQTFAVFEAKGVKDIGRVYEHILKEWLPKSSYKRGVGPDFEYYGDDFEPDDAANSKLRIYFPVLKR